MNRILLVLTCIILLLLGMDTTAGVDDAYNSSVKILINNSFAGSGTLIKLNNKDDFIILTAAHVIKGRAPQDITACGVATKKCSDIQTVHISSDKDLAVITLSSEIAKSGKIAGKYSPKLGDKFLISGSPNGISITGTGELVALDPTHGLVNFVCVGGSSGGGVFFKGKLVGTVVAVPIYQFIFPAIIEDLCIVEWL